jgi:hypothetical protein
MGSEQTDAQKASPESLETQRYPLLKACFGTTPHAKDLDAQFDDIFSDPTQLQSFVDNVSTLKVSEIERTLANLAKKSDTAIDTDTPLTDTSTETGDTVDTEELSEVEADIEKIIKSGKCPSSGKIGNLFSRVHSPGTDGHARYSS